MSLTPLRKVTNLSPDAQLERERLASLINSMADGVIATDELGKVVMYNAASLDILDRNTSIKDMAIESVLSLLDKHNEPVDVKQLIRGAKIPVISRDYRIRYRTDNSVINLYLSIAPVRLGYGKGGQGGFVLVLRDITREKSLEEEKDEFISVASHELRTPITIAEGNVSNAQFVINKGGDVSQITKALEVAHQQILALTDLINDLATLSRAERGKLTMEMEVINPHDLVLQLVQDNTNLAKEKGLRFLSELDPKLELLHSSKLYIKEVLQNFVSNSIKYTEKGSVTICAVSMPGGVLFKVVDTGIGISVSDQQKIFNKFFRSEDFRTRQSNGTGLGLYVTAKLANLLNAKITVSSQLNVGSAFSIFVPDNKSITYSIVSEK
jgi:PAS domain S-box-containing protein